MRRSLLLLALLGATAPLGGCGSSHTIAVTGKLLKGGAPYHAPEGQRVAITLYVVEARDAAGQPLHEGEPYAAVLNSSDATFHVPGPDGRGVPPGKYRVGVEQKLTPSALATAKAPPRKSVDREADQFFNRYSPEHSPIVRELKESGELVIDLDRPN